jgi:hypothetical protein
VKRNTDVEATIVGKFLVMSPLLDERARRLWAAAESAAIGYGGDALVSAATGLARETIRNGRRELAQGVKVTGRIRQPGGGRPDVEETQPGVTEALDLLVEPLTRGDPMSPLRWTCKSRAKLTAALTAQGWRVSSTTVGHLLHALGYRLQALRKTQEGTSHPDRNAQFEHINAAAAAFLNQQQPRSPSIRRRRNWSAISRRRGGNGSRRARLSPSACTIFPATRSAKPSRTASMTWRATKRG